MLYSIALIFIVGLMLSQLFQRFHLPSLIGMILTGILLGPFVLNLIDPSLLAISADLRQMALIVILIRAGLTLNIGDLKKVGRPAILMSFIPATFELITVTILAPLFFPITYLEAAIMGAVLAAVSPAVVVPRMISLIEEKKGTNKSVPQLILAGASVDDIYVIVLFTSFMGMEQGASFSVLTLATVPISILLGVIAGILIGLAMVWLFKTFHMRDTVKVLLILSISFLLVTLETVLQGILPISGLLAVMALGAVLLKKYAVLANRITSKFSKIWVGAEMLLFVLVGAEVDIQSLTEVGFLAVVMIFVALAFRMLGVFLSLLKTPLSLKERLFCAIAYIPKATVQAAIGSLPLAAGVGAGEMILAVAVLSILISAPLGSIGIDATKDSLLTHAS